MDGPPVEFVKAREIAARYSVSTRTVHNWIKAGRFPAVRVGKVTRIRLEDVVAAMEGGNPTR